MSAVLDWEFPEKMGFLFEPHRYKVAHGGRDGSKSHSYARAILLQAAERPLRVGCFREVQKSIKESVHQLLQDSIKSLGLQSEYEVFETEIRGRNGSLIGFSGLSNMTAMSIKSWEGLDIAWVEEAQTTKARSWEILIPTIRKPDSEIWVTFNPELDTDDTYVRFVTRPPPGAKVVQINWYDNPWRSKVLDEEREHLKATDPQGYEHVYGGACRPAVVGALYYKEVSELRSKGRLCNVPIDPMLKTHIVVDLGFNDYMSLLLVQRLMSEIRIVGYIEDRFRDIPSYSAQLRDLRLNWGKVYLPHDSKARTLAAANNPNGSTAEEQFQRLGWDTEQVPNVDIEQGIRKAREVFPRVAIDNGSADAKATEGKGCGRELLNRLGRYRRRHNADGQGTTPVHDDASHGSDGFRYLALVADQLSNDNGTVIEDPYAAFRSRRHG